MSTITGTQGEKVDQLTQLFLAQQAQLRLLQWVGTVTLPLIVALDVWIVSCVTTTQSDVKLINQRLDQMEKGNTERFGRIDRALQKLDERLEKGKAE